jgi:hypothetical protein
MLPFFFPEGLKSFVKINCIADEISRLDEILDKHAASILKFKKIQKEEADVVRTIQSKPIGKEFDGVISEVEKDPLFIKNYGDVPHEFKMLELSKIVAFQSQLNLDYVEDLTQHLKGNKTDAEIMKLCFSSSYDPTQVSFTKMDDNTYVLSSKNSNLRFLGSEIKGASTKGSDFDVKGLQTNVIGLVVGFGTSKMNVISTNQKIFLNNGFHRACALYSMGIQYAPFIVLNLANPFSEFPENFLNVPRDIALNTPRPTLVKDFMNQDLVIDLKAKRKVKSVGVKFETHEFEVVV